MRNRIIAFGMTVALIIGLLPLTVVAADSSLQNTSISIGDYLTLGTYYGEPILWRCVDIDENGPLMLSDKILCLKSFDASWNQYPISYRKSGGSNYWNDSCIRTWLNSEEVSVSYGKATPDALSVYNGYNAYDKEAGFLTNFSDEELALIKPVIQKTYLNSADAANAEGGSSKYDIGYIAFSALPTVIPDKWYDLSEDRMFLLGPEQAAAVCNNLGEDYLLAGPTASAVENSEMKNEKLSENLDWHYWLRLPMNTGMSYQTVSIVTENKTTASCCANNMDSDERAYPGIRPAFYLADGFEEIQCNYVNEHVSFYQSDYTSNIVSMGSTAGLGYILDDSNEDLDIVFYKGMSFGVADAKMFASFISPTSYFDIDWGNGNRISFKVPDLTVADIGSSEYSVILYQLMANDESYQGILDTFSMQYEKNIYSFASRICDNSLTLIKNDINLTSEEAANVKKTLMTEANTIRSADADSLEFKMAYANFERLGEMYLDLNETKEYLASLSSVANDTFAFFGAILDELDSIGSAYQYACWAESYAITDNLFKEVLTDLANAADQRAKELHWSDPYGEGSMLEPYTEAGMCLGLSRAIESFIDTMEKNTEDTQKQFISQIKDATGDSCVDLVVDFLSDKALGGSICPELAAINTALSSGKLLVDLFTDIDDEYKYALTVESLDIISRLLKDLSEQYGNSLLVEEEVNHDGTIAQLEPVPLEARFERALRFDKSINMYKNAMLLACDFGTKYEDTKLTKAVKMASSVPDWWYDNIASTPWQKQASKASTAITLLALQKAEIQKIHCHNNGVDNDSLTRFVQYSSSMKAVDIACPVDVTVIAPDGTQVAHLTNSLVDVASGYEPYFYVRPISDNDYVKVAVIPDDKDYQILVSGTGRGTMSVIIGRYDGSEIAEVETYANYHITEDTTGYLGESTVENPLGDLVLSTPIGHSREKRESREPTCTEAGNSEYYSCTNCGKYFSDEACTNEIAKDSWIIPALGHSFTTYVYNNDAKVGVDGTETATCDRDGCHATDTRTAAGTALPAPTVTFIDVPSSAYYAPAVNWAVANNITAGTTPTTFSPNDTCTRAQVVAFLWRTAGRPEPKTSNNPFADVKSTDYFYKAVLWASENGIVYGTSGTTFSPNQGCTRAQVAAFLWRAMGRPEPTTGNNPFTDVRASEYYSKAVIWAAENKIVYGTSTTQFSPDASCTRAQIVTFLYRTYGK